METHALVTFFFSGLSLIKASQTGCQTASTYLVPPAQFDWIASALLYVLGTAPSHLRIRIQLHATRMVGGSRTSNADVEKEPSTPDGEMESMEWLNTPGITVRSGRPDVKRMLAEEVEAASTAGSICVHGGCHDG